MGVIKWLLKLEKPKGWWIAFWNAAALLYWLFLFMFASGGSLAWLLALFHLFILYPWIKDKNYTFK